MIIILKPRVTPSDVQPIKDYLVSNGIIIQEIVGETTQMIGMAGDTSVISEDKLLVYPCVDRIMHVQEPYKLAGRKFHPGDSAVEIAGRRIGGGGFEVIAGPCSVESREQITQIARLVKQSGAGLMRGGAFKPRTSPYAFKGLGLDGLELLKTAKAETGLPIVTELMSPEYIDAFERDVDVIQIGARNMQNYTLLQRVGQLKKPVLLKRGMSSTLDELLMAAEYLMANGCRDVILCERGIRTFETATRNTLDLSAVPALKARSHLPVVVDPSHSTGYWQYVEPMALAAVAAGCDGLIIEVHNHPESALCDGAQSITPAAFDRMMGKIRRIREAVAPAESVV